MRYIRAFFLALWMTIRGEKIVRPYEPLWAWAEKTPQLVQAVYRAADQHHMREDTRKKITLKIEGRDVSIQTILSGIEFHAKQEYPYLLEHLTDHTITAIYASNMNDQFHVRRLLDADLLPEQQALATLNEHLASIPPSNELEPSKQTHD